MGMNVALICIFLMTNNGERVVICLTGHLHIFCKVYVQIFCLFLNWAVLFLKCKSSLYILDRSPFDIYKYFLPVYALAFHFITKSFDDFVISL